MIALFAAAAVAIALLEPAIPPQSGTATASDGDSLRLGGERIRLVGIDAPEFDQTCDRDAGAWPCGREARDLMREILQRGAIECAPAGRDRYGRILARCRSGSDDIGALMVAAGLAVADGEYRREEQRAKSDGVGLWSGSFERPSDWRRGRQEEAEGFDFAAWLRSLF